MTVRGRALVAQDIYARFVAGQQGSRTDRLVEADTLAVASSETSLPPPACTCWFFPDPQGVTRPATWFRMHDRVVVRTVRGWKVEGATAWGFAGPPNERRPVLVVRQDDGSNSWCPPGDVEAIEPVTSHAIMDLAAAMIGALATPRSVPDEGLTLSAIVDHHHRVEIRLKITRFDCQPSPQGLDRPSPSC